MELTSPEEAITLEMRTTSSPLSDKNRSGYNYKSDFFYCSAGKNSFSLTPDGKMNICLQYRHPQYDIQKAGLAQHWKNLVTYAKSMHRHSDSTHHCKKCEFEPTCQWCPAVGLLENNDSSTCSPYYKELAKLRKTKREEWSL